MDEQYSENLDSLEASFLGEKPSVLSELRAEDQCGHFEQSRLAEEGEGNSEDELEDPTQRAQQEASKRMLKEGVKRQKDSARAPAARTKQYQHTHNTGPKGILADYHRAQEAKIEVCAILF